MEEQSQVRSMSSVERVVGGSVELAQRASLWVAGQVKRKNSCGRVVVGGGARWRALGSGHEQCGEGIGWRSSAKAELGTVWRGLSSEEALGSGDEHWGEGIGWTSRAKPEL